MSTQFFAIVDNLEGLIWGVGCSPCAAWNNSEEWTNDDEGNPTPSERDGVQIFRCERITRSLYKRVRERGGAERYDERPDGVYTIRRS
jgi:hypothetical protein